MNTDSVSIIVLDDEAHAVSMAELTLRAAGVSAVFGFTSWEETQTALASIHCDLLLLDIGMNPSGIEILRWMRAEKPQIPVVMLTAYNDAETAVTCMKLGAADYLVKPASPEKLNAMIQSVLVYSNFVKNESEDLTMKTDEPIRAKESMESLTLWITTLPWEQSPLLLELQSLLVEKKFYTDSDCTLEKVSKLLLSNRTTLSSQLNQQLNTSFITLVNHLRIAHFMAESLQADSIYSVEGLAKRAGFTTLSAFYEAFKKCVGTTPAQWIRSQK